MDGMKRVPIKEQEPKVRAANFEEVCLGYSEEEAVEEAKRCLQCKKPLCVQGCPVSIDIPAFIKKITERDFKGRSRSHRQILCPSGCVRTGMSSGDSVRRQMYPRH